MAASFACPHCNKSYPCLATLVNRKVRCQDCRKPFRLRPDGSVEALESQRTMQVDRRLAEAAVTAVQAPEPAAVAADARQEQLRQLTRTWSDNAAGSIARHRSRRSSEGIATEKPVTSRAEALRKAASNNLKDAAARAAEVVEPSTTEKQARSKVRQSSIGDPLDRQIIARLSGSGSNRARSRRLTVLAVVAVVLLLGLATVLFGGPEDERLQALEAYAADRAQPSTQAWLSSTDGRRPLLRLADPGAVRLEQPMALDLTPILAYLERTLAGMVPVDELALYAPAERQRDIQSLAAMQLPRPRVLEQLEADGVHVLTYEELLEGMRSSSGDPDAVVVMSLLLAGGSGRADVRPWRDLLLAGRQPDLCEIAAVGGSGALSLRFEGSVARIEELPAWGGLLMRCRGEGWDGPWRVLTCYDRSDEHELQNPLLRRARQIAQRTAFNP